MEKDESMPDNEVIEVAVALPVYGSFTYHVPETFATLITVGKRVLVPFGQRRVTAYVLEACKDVALKDLKSILDVLDDRPLFPPSMIPFFRWIADYYKHPLGDVIKNALPGGLNLYDDDLLVITPKGQSILQTGSFTPLEQQILSRLTDGPCTRRKLFRSLKDNLPGALLHSLEHRGWIDRRRKLKGGRTKPRLERYVRLRSTVLPVDHLSKVRRTIIDLLKSEGEISVRQLKQTVPTAPTLIKSMEKDGYLRILQQRVYRDPFGEQITPRQAPNLTGEQATVVSEVCSSLAGGFRTYLLKGVTGSGKTEVYMQVADEAIKKGYNVLVLVPEIALITQMERRFRARFGECVSILHSGLSAGERFDQWSRILKKEVTIAIGARSAVFAPFSNIGIIVVDEEHDSSYKQETGLRYNARDLAVVRAKLDGCVALLGSATPSIQSYYNACTKKFREVTLHNRIEERPLATIHVVDLRQDRDARGFRRYISLDLQQAMNETLQRKEQVLLFLNRRGYANFPVCAACGQPMRCKHCDISLTFHQRANAYRCHYCGFSRSAVSNCSVCGSSNIKKLGLGTEKVEQVVQKLFPDARVARMDRDTTRRKGAILNLLKGLRNKTIDILVGTQMVAKGHDFPNITLVGIICADLSLSFPDFRAGERTFQLLAQVAGRAGRGRAPGRVILQTYNPDHFSILAAKSQDFEMFYQQEINFRKALKYPPFSRMIQLKIAGRDKTKTRITAQKLGDICQRVKDENGSQFLTVEILGPIEASLPRIAERYRWQILLKALNVKSLHHFMGRLLVEDPADFNRRDVRVVIDVDPFFMM